jgi:hypothetical protein
MELEPVKKGTGSPTLFITYDIRITFWILYNYNFATLFINLIVEVNNTKLLLNQFKIQA